MSRPITKNNLDVEQMSIKINSMQTAYKSTEPKSFAKDVFRIMNDVSRGDSDVVRFTESIELSPFGAWVLCQSAAVRSDVSGMKWVEASLASFITPAADDKEIEREATSDGKAVVERAEKLIKITENERSLFGATLHLNGLGVACVGYYALLLGSSADAMRLQRDAPHGGANQAAKDAQACSKKLVSMEKMIKAAVKQFEDPESEELKQITGWLVSFQVSFKEQYLSKAVKEGKITENEKAEIIEQSKVPITKVLEQIGSALRSAALSE